MLHGYKITEFYNGLFETNDVIKMDSWRKYRQIQIIVVEYDLPRRAF